MTNSAVRSSGTKAFEIVLSQKVPAWAQGVRFQSCFYPTFSHCDAWHSLPFPHWRKSFGSTARTILECGDPGSLLVEPPTPHFTGWEARSPVPETWAPWSLPCRLTASGQELSPRTAECLVLGQSGWLGLQGPNHTRLAVLPLSSRPNLGLADTA